VCGVCVCVFCFVVVVVVVFVVVVVLVDVDVDVADVGCVVLKEQMDFPQDRQLLLGEVAQLLKQTAERYNLAVRIVTLFQPNTHTHTGAGKIDSLAERLTDRQTA
jgi:hypothetical protein